MTPAPWPEPSGFDAVASEEDLLERWRDERVFARSLELREQAPSWTFYEGPPTANGSPGVHHVESRVFKDVFPRHRTMKGWRVVRRAGWDCHGLPVELEVERELGLDSKADIEAYGIEAFNARCRESVQRYVADFEALTERIAFWVDLDAAYWTMDPEYVDSVWWALSELHARDLLFEAHRVAPYCGRCGTGLSDAEVALGYRSVEDLAVFVRLPLRDGTGDLADAALLVWTTTPWTLPSNTAAAVGPDVTYALVDHQGHRLVLAASQVAAVLGEDARVVREVGADELVGLHYSAPFTLEEMDLVEAATDDDGELADLHRVLAADFVEDADGSGLVHEAPAFGAEDLELCRAAGLPILNPVDAAARFTTGPWAGEFVRDADAAIVETLRARGVLLQAEPYEHSYPFCWRCDTALIYWAKPSWYVRTTARREELLRDNARIDWHPEHIRDGRFGDWLANNVDWALSRDRYWGTPLPVWRCPTGHVTVVASRAELGRLAGEDLSELDPHRPYVDEITLDCPECGAAATRVPHVIDAWFDSGAMPYAQWGYPHRGEAEFERHFPAQYICEAIDQTRGWFYTLLAESTLLFDTAAYETCLVLGHIVDAEGAKMSKSRGNVLAPSEVLDRHGADALRWLMFGEGNPWVNRRVGHGQLEKITRRFLLTLWNTHVFFTTYARIDGFSLADDAPAVADRPAVDRWALAELADAVATVDASLEAFDVTSACRRVERFVDDLSNWYVRRNRRRFWKAAADDPVDKAAAYRTLHTCLVTVAGLMAPMAPFLADRLWRDLVVGRVEDAADSVHLSDFPSVDEDWVDDELREAMDATRRVVELGRTARSRAQVRVRQPLRRALVTVPQRQRDGVERLSAEITDELNVRELELVDATDGVVDVALVPNFRAIGPAFQQRAPVVADALRSLDPAAAAALAGDVADGGSGTLAVDGDEVEVSGQMFDVVETPRTGWELVSERGTSVALDLELDDDLRAEGVARELVRALNDRRKDLDLQLDQRVSVGVAAPEPLLAALREREWVDVIAREVLADHVETRARPADEGWVRVGLDDGDAAYVAVWP